MHAFSLILFILIFHSGFRMMSDVFIRLSENQLVDPKDFRLAGVIIFAALLVFALAGVSLIVLWASFFVLTVVLAVGARIQRSRRDARFRLYFREYLDRVILFQRVGHSFRRALVEANQGSPDWFARRMKEALEVIELSKPVQGRRFIDDVVRELGQIERASAKTLQMALSYRGKLLTEEEFASKVEAVLKRYHIQAVVMIFLFVLFGLGSVWFHGLRQVLPFALWSAPAFLIGTVWTLREGRSVKWKV